MKAEKRHELQQNELAGWLGEQIETAKPYASTIAFVALGIAAIVALVIYLNNAGNPASAGSWSRYLAAFNDREPTVALEELAEKEPDSPAALWALQSVGDLNLAQGSMQLFTDREEAKKSLEKAEKAYLEVEKKATSPMLKSAARLGLAKLYEAQNKPGEAKKFYELVVQAEKDSAIGKAAAEGVERMSDPREVELLAWFAAQKPRKPAPFPGPGGIPGLPNDLPERPDLSLPNLSDPAASSDPPPGSLLDLQGIGSGKTEPSKDEFPKPASTNPADKPAEKPSEADKPAEPQPE
jgi:hypothetical protein